ncbi:thiosulfate sulfurtransferase GlpE [Ferrimonas lipolytica]|uniref:Thiosulfate sulfurtransferase GlpE n=1 Tax=Ferrimonas lipolytica TaxID=2724191 RepID=A0A6H1UGY1_9GAMM|nr:thiosulfate sulfurtransferase GlpE [Ferrimonas lipolytica]QIZ78365.1 thiosulfate sulfurtransferase GlpE [Ferrimonas lipolytica]
MSQYQCISLAQFAQLQQQSLVQVVDIRQPDVFAAGNIPGSLNLHQGNVDRFLLEGEYDEPVVVVCYHGISSQNAAQYLVEQGFEQVYSLNGGFEDWAKQQASASA